VTVRTVVLGPPSPEISALIARRHALGLDTHDEVWEGAYHVAAAAHPFHGYLYEEVASILRPLARAAALVPTSEFNLGEPHDYRVPDGGLHRALPTVAFVRTAAVVIEIESPDDETWEKLGFYARHGVDEVLVVSGGERKVTWLMLRNGGYVEAEESSLLGAESHGLSSRIIWPPVEDQPTV
jgi:hypothetical protein